MGRLSRYLFHSVRLVRTLFFCTSCCKLPNNGGASPSLVFEPIIGRQRKNATPAGVAFLFCGRVDCRESQCISVG